MIGVLRAISRYALAGGSQSTTARYRVAANGFPRNIADGLKSPNADGFQSDPITLQSDPSFFRRRHFEA